MIRSILCDHSDAHILVKGTITIQNTAAAGAAVNNANKKVIFKKCASFTDCINEMNNTQVDDAQRINVVMAMYNLIEYSDAYSKTSGSLWQYYRDEPALKNNGDIIDFSENNNIRSFKFKQQNNRANRNAGTKDVEIIVPLKCLSNFFENTWNAFN